MNRHNRVFQCASAALLLASIVPTRTEATTGWQSWGPDGGRIDGFAQARSDPDRIYALPYLLGAFRSDDRGDTWARVDVSGLPAETELRHAAVSPADENLVIVGRSASDRIYRSTDGGVTWTERVVGGGWGPLHAIEFDPHDPTRVLIAAGGGADPGIHVSTDGGVKWIASNTGIATLDPKTIAFDPSAAGTVLTGTSDGIYRSTDAGASWSLVDTSGNTSVSSIAFCEGVPARVWAVAFPDGIVRSDDGGATFVAAPDSLIIPGIAYPNQVAVSPVDPDLVVVGRLWWYCTGDCIAQMEILRTADGWMHSSTVYSSGEPLDNQRFTRMAFDAEFPQRLYTAVGNDGSSVSRVGLLRSLDSGISWTRAMSGISGLRVLGMGYGPSGEVYVRRDGRKGLWRAAGVGAPWIEMTTAASSLYAPAAFEVSTTTTDRLHESGAVPSFDTLDARFFWSEDGGQTWGYGFILQSELFSWPDVLASNHGSGQTIYVWSGVFWPELYRSDDGGLLFTTIDPAFRAADAVVDPADPHRLFAVEGNGVGEVKLSTDAGVTWLSRSSGLPSDEPIGLFQDPVVPEHLAVVYETAGAWRSEDEGLTWTEVWPNLGGAVVVDADWDPVADRFFLATDHGVLVDGIPVNEGLEASDLTSIVHHPQGEALLLGTDHEGVWTLDLAGAIGAPGPPIDAPTTGLALGVLPNPFDSSTEIVASFPQEGVKARVSIFDVAGRRVFTLFSGVTSSRTQSLVWDGTSASGELAAPGVYFVKAEAAGESVVRRVVRVAR